MIGTLMLIGRAVSVGTTVASAIAESTRKPYVPMHAESVYSFSDDHCTECVKDANEDCPHLAAAFRGEVSTWVMDGAGNVSCTAKRLPGEPDRCPHTLELPL